MLNLLFLTSVTHGVRGISMDGAAPEDFSVDVSVSSFLQDKRRRSHSHRASGCGSGDIGRRHRPRETSEPTPNPVDVTELDPIDESNSWTAGHKLENNDSISHVVIDGENVAAALCGGQGAIKDFEPVLLDYVTKRFTNQNQHVHIVGNYEWGKAYNAGAFQGFRGLMRTQKLTMHFVSATEEARRYVRTKQDKAAAERLDRAADDGEFKDECKKDPLYKFNTGSDDLYAMRLAAETRGILITNDQLRDWGDLNWAGTWLKHNNHDVHEWLQSNGFDKPGSCRVSSDRVPLREYAPQNSTTSHPESIGEPLHPNAHRQGRLMVPTQVVTTDGAPGAMKGQSVHRPARFSPYTGGPASRTRSKTVDEQSAWLGDEQSEWLEFCQRREVPESWDLEIPEGFQLFRQPKDNSCFFHSIAAALIEHDENHRAHFTNGHELRPHYVQLVVSKLNNDENPIINAESRTTLRKAIGDETLSQWATRVLRQDEWGGSEDAMILASLFNVRIIEHIRDGSVNDGEDQIHEPASGKPCLTIHLLKSEGHYDLLKPTQVVPTDGVPQAIGKQSVHRPARRGRAAHSSARGPAFGTRSKTQDEQSARGRSPRIALREEGVTTGKSQLPPRRKRSRRTREVLESCEDEEGGAMPASPASEDEV